MGKFWPTAITINLAAERRGRAFFLPGSAQWSIAMQSGLDPLDYRHPIVQAFRGREKAGLLTTPIAKHYRLELPKDSAARVVLAMHDSDPLVVEQPIRRGRVVLVATSADTSWTAMPVWPSYVPLLQEMLAWCVGGRNRQQNVAVGEPLEGSAPTAAAESHVRLQRPDGQSRQITLHAEGDYGVWTYDDTLRSGIYTATLGSPAYTQRFAVNVDTRQSDLAALGEEDLRSEVWPNIPFLYRTSRQGVEAARAGSMAGGAPLHIGLLYAVFGLLFVETFLAWRFGHHAP